MPLPELKIGKNWFDKTRTKEENWDALRLPVVNWGAAVNKGFQQVILDAFGADYPIFNSGAPNFTNSIYSDLQAIIAGNLPFAVFRNGWMANLGFTSVDIAGESEILQFKGANGDPLSLTNKAYVGMRSAVDHGKTKTFEITNGPLMNMNGLNWGFLGKGDVSDVVLRMGLINENDTNLHFALMLQGGRTEINAANCFTTKTSITAPEHVFVDSAVAAGTWPMMEVGWGMLSYTDSATRWELIRSVSDIHPGKSGDGMMSLYNPVYTGFSAAPSGGFNQFCMIGKMVYVEIQPNVGTSNATGFTVTLPIKPKRITSAPCGPVTDNGSLQAGAGLIKTLTPGSAVATVYKTLAEGAWTNAAGKNAWIQFKYEAFE